MIGFLRFRHVEPAAGGMQLDLDACQAGIFGERDLRILGGAARACSPFRPARAHGRADHHRFRVSGGDRETHV
jgi:hypothetical protein